MVWIFSICVGVAIELSFQALKRLHVDQPWENQANSYWTTEDVVRHRVSWVKYCAFRLIPPCIGFLFLASILTKYWPDSFKLPLLLLAALISVIPRDVRQILFARLTIGRRVVHACISLVVLLLALCIFGMSTLVDLATLAPSLPDIINDLWSVLLVLVLGVAYWSLTSTSQTTTDTSSVSEYEFIRERYLRIRHRLEVVIAAASREFDASKALLFAIAIYEDMNRPRWIRWIENALVFLPGVQMTVGICQVKSSKPLSDAESIALAAEQYLSGTLFADEKKPDLATLASILSSYNKGDKYASQIYHIMSRIEMIQLVDGA